MSLVPVALLGLAALLAGVLWFFAVWLPRRRFGFSLTRGFRVERPLELPDPDRIPAGFRLVRQFDPAFSRLAFLAYARALWVAFLEARVLLSRTPAGMSPWLEADAMARAARSRAAQPPARELRDLLVGAIVPTAVTADEQWTRVELLASATFTLVHGDGREEPRYLSERVTVRRPTPAVQPPPGSLLVGGCASCGAAFAFDRDGRCGACSAPAAHDAAAWRVAELEVIADLPREELDAQPPEQRPAAGPRPVQLAADLAPAQRRLEARHPGFSMEAFLGEARVTYLSLQHAWSQGDLERLAAGQAPGLFESARFGLERFARCGWRNVVEDLELLDLTPARVEADPAFETVTLWARAQARDYVVDRAGAVVAGDAKTPVTFAEYWTFASPVLPDGALAWTVALVESDEAYGA